ncbi:hypothetical protein GCM10009795_045130 [Nocardioides hankookensis]|uniref:Uncharacterized protein n=1 Tax=Nocardioides hankookensis TaxID=443157 RepID=A0ABW1LQ88_9ACTN
MSTPEEPPEPAPTYRTDPVPVEPEEPVVPYGPPAPVPVPVAATPTPVRLPKVLWVIPAVVAMLVVVGITTAIIAASTGGDSDSATEAVAGGPGGDVLTADGYDELLDAVDDEAGSTWVFDAVLYPAYAVVSIPADATSQRQESFYWDGSDLSSNDSKSTASFDRFDMSRVEGQVLVDLVDRVKLLVEDPTTWYTIVRAPDQDRAVVWAYATNEYGETAYLGARRDGTVVYDSTQH